MLLQIIISVILFVIGFCISSFGICQILTVVRVGIHMVNKLCEAGVTAGINTMKKLYRSTIVFWAVVLVASIALIVLFATKIEMYAFFGGLLIAFLIGVGQTGINSANSEDFINTYEKYSSNVSEDENNKIFDVIREELLERE